MDAKQRIKDKLRSAYNREDRIAIGVSGLLDHVYTDVTPIEKWEIREAYYSGPGKYEWIDAKWRPCTIGDPWGGDNRTGFFRAKAAVPKSFRGKPLYMKFKLGGEALLKLNGKPFHGLDPEHSIVFIDHKSTGAEKFDIEIEGYVRQMFEEVVTHKLYEACLLSIDKAMEDIYYDFHVAHEVAQIDDIDPELSGFLLDNIEDALKLIDTYETDPDRYRANAKKAQAHLRKTVYSTDKFKSAGKLALVSNCHIDLVYMWPYREFQRKIARAHSSQLNLLREFPEFIFTQSQPKMYDDIKELYPDIFERIRKMVKAGRWEVIGAMYVEPDSNLVSGESFIRQILFGLRFLEKEFGKTTRTCWLPDVFGNSWIMPQILKQCGIDYFITNKLVVWNDTNEFPYNSFMWQGVDGSQVVSHFPGTHFGAAIDPDIVHLNWKDYKEKRETGEAMYNYGHGDGRGGPTRENMHIAKRLADFPGMPQCKIDYAESYFDRLAKNADKLPIWDNELYLETHRGTYTTQAELKKSNRRAELLYREAEAMCAIATLYEKKYPREEFVRGWKLILKNQFHDILPGSHVTQACIDAKDDYKTVFKIGYAACEAAVSAISKRISSPSPALAVFNSASWQRTDIAFAQVPAVKGGIAAIAPDGTASPAQVIRTDGRTATIAFVAKDVPSFGYKVFRVDPSDAPSQKSKNTPSSLENGFLKIAFAPDGYITSIIHKETGREVLNGKKGNVFQVFEDKPGRYSAWDIIAAYKEKEWKVSGLKSSKIVEAGPVRTVLRQERAFLNSRMIQNIIIYNDIPRIDFETWVDWREHEKILKVGFPADIFARTATYDLSFGNIERPTHGNTTWDRAKFEVCGHQWADISEPGFGVSLLNDCKYGHDIRDGLMRLTLLRATTAPDPTADRGEHTFTYSLYPHAGDWREALTARRAFELNQPLNVVSIKKQSGDLPLADSFVSIDAPNVFISAMKLAEDSNSIVVRFYENDGARGPVNVAFDKRIRSAVEITPVEKKKGPAKTSGKTLCFAIRPYEIKSFMVSF